jgi:hypothetical protein
MKYDSITAPRGAHFGAWTLVGEMPSLWATFDGHGADLWIAAVKNDVLMTNIATPLKHLAFRL